MCCKYPFFFFVVLLLYVLSCGGLFLFHVDVIFPVPPVPEIKSSSRYDVRNIFLTPSGLKCHG